LLTISSLSWLFCLDNNNPDLQKSLSHEMDVAGVHESLNVPLLDKARSSIQESILLGMLDPENEVTVIL
jgi:hypothetical protein